VFTDIILYKYLYSWDTWTTVEILWLTRMNINMKINRRWATSIRWRRQQWPRRRLNRRRRRPLQQPHPLTFTTARVASTSSTIAASLSSFRPTIQCIAVFTLLLRPSARSRLGAVTLARFIYLHSTYLYSFFLIQFS
jgi:hypothetical protein